MQFETSRASPWPMLAFLGSAAALALRSSVAASATTPGDSSELLAGSWVAQGRNVPAIAGRITIDRSRDYWWAAAGRMRALGVAGAGRLTFAFPGGRGELRVRAPIAGGAGYGLWIQPGSRIDGNQYATPVRFTPIAGERWTGVLQPYVPRFELYVQIVRRPDGSLGGFFRDPVGNFGTMSDFTSITVNGRSFVLHRRNRNHYGLLDAGAHQFRLSVGAGGRVVFRRVTVTAAHGLFPKASDSRAAIGVPARLADGWVVAAPGAVHVDGSLLASLDTRLGRLRPTSARSPYIQSVLVARDGRLVLEDYYFGFTRQTPHDVRSAGKSLTAAMFGIALRKNPALNVQSRVLPWFTFRPRNPDPRKERITAGDLLDMASGLACDDNDDNSPGNEDTMQSQAGQPNWYEYTLDLPMVREPGLRRAVYCSAGINLAGGVIGRATRSWTPQLFEEEFARPLQFGEHHLQLMPGKEMYLGGGSYFLPRDFLKLGQLFLDAGTWHGRRIVSASWVKDATSAHSGLNAPNDYGYAWHLTTYRAHSVTYRAFEAQGNGGQLLVVVPRLKLVVQILAANYGDYMTWRTFRDLIERYVVAACR